MLWCCCDLLIMRSCCYYVVAICCCINAMLQEILVTMSYLYLWVQWWYRLMPLRCMMKLLCDVACVESHALHILRWPGLAKQWRRLMPVWMPLLIGNWRWGLKPWVPHAFALLSRIWCCILILCDAACDDLLLLWCCGVVI